jgi:hypothetical protein
MRWVAGPVDDQARAREHPVSYASSIPSGDSARVAKVATAMCRVGPERIGSHVQASSTVKSRTSW